MGFDLYGAEESLLKPGAHTLLKTNIVIQLPKFSYGRIVAKSGLDIKGIIPIVGVIDSDYRGNIRVILLNTGKNDYKIKVGSQIAHRNIRVILLTTGKIIIKLKLEVKIARMIVEKIFLLLLHYDTFSIFSCRL